MSRNAKIMGCLPAALRLLLTAAANAKSYKILYSFAGGSDGSDGYSPVATLLVDPRGAIYGTTEYGGGGAHDFGTVFRIKPD